MPFGVFILFRKSPFASAAPKAASKAALNTCSYVRIPRINQRAQSTTIETTLLLPFKRESSVMWERSKCPPPPRFGEILPRRRRRLEKERSTTRDDFDERREENLTLLETKARKKKRRTNAFSLSNSRSLAKEKITTGGALVRVRAFCAKVSKL